MRIYGHLVVVWLRSQPASSRISDGHSAKWAKIVYNNNINPKISYQILNVKLLE
jgi:hypothetical protein